MATFYRRRLPHLHQPGHPLFITFRLAGSLPPQRIFWDRDITRRDQFLQYDRLLDRSRTGPTYLRQPAVAQALVASMLHIQSEGWADFDSWTILPNHVHVITSATDSMPKVLRWLKGRSAQAANVILHRHGPFWQRESFDHLIRDDDQLRGFREYIANNPVQAGLCAQPEDWPWTHIRKD